MLKAYDVMNHKLATCTPDTNVSQVAQMMRDRDIGDVLILENGKLGGIVTDRDIALRGLTGDDDLRQTPIKKLMSTKVVTGDADWNLERVANVMAKHQVRRLPIMKEGQLVGIISLGDIALHEKQKEVVTKSLQAISSTNGFSIKRRSGFGTALIGLSLAAFATTMLARFTWNRPGKTLREQLKIGNLTHTARQAMGTARNKVNVATAGKKLRELRQQMRAMPRIKIGAQ